MASNAAVELTPPPPMRTASSAPNAPQRPISKCSSKRKLPPSSAPAKEAAKNTSPEALDAFVLDTEAADAREDAAKKTTKTA